MATHRVLELIGWLRVSALTLAPPLVLANDAPDAFETKVRPILTEWDRQGAMEPESKGIRVDYNEKVGRKTPTDRLFESQVSQ